MATNTNAPKMARIKRELDEIFVNTGVTPDQTVQDLEQIIDYAKTLIQPIEETENA